MLGFGDYFFKAFIIFGLIFLVIALATYFTGCNPNVENGCTSYNPFDPGYIYDHKIEKDRCKECVSRKNGKCKSYRYYDCYNAYAYADKGANSSSWCKLQVAYHDKDKSDAQDELDKYPIGKEVHWLKLKNSDICRTPKAAYDLWVTGVVFFGLFGLFFLIPVGKFIYDGSSNSNCRWPCIKQRQSAYDEPSKEGEKFDGPGAVQMT